MKTNRVTIRIAESNRFETIPCNFRRTNIQTLFSQYFMSFLNIRTAKVYDRVSMIFVANCISLRRTLAFVKRCVEHQFRVIKPQPNPTRFIAFS